MSKKTFFSSFPILLESLSKFPAHATNPTDSAANGQPQPGKQALSPQMAVTNPADSPELHRIATALERIALALEKLTNEGVEVATENDSGEDAYWITLPDTDPTECPQPPSELPLLEVTLPPAEPVDRPVVNVIPDKAKELVIKSDVKLATPPLSNLSYSVLHKYLKERNIAVQESKKEATDQRQTLERNLEHLASYLGQNFTDCQEFYRLLKRNMVAPRNPFSYSLKGFTSEQNKKLRDFCLLLQEAELVEGYLYRGKPDYTIELKATGKEQKYINGSWLEYHTRLEVERIANLNPTRSGGLYEALPNLQVVFKDNSKAELDLLFALGQSVFCVEAKMRPSLADLKAYLTRIEGLKLDNKAVLIVVVDKTEEECLQLSQALGNVKIARLNNLEQAVTSLLKINL